MPRRRGSSGTWWHLEAHGVGTKLTHRTRALRSPLCWPIPCPSARIAPPMKPANPPTYSRYSLGRRRFLALVSGGLVVAPVAAHAQQPALPVIGFLGTSTAAAWAGYVAEFRQRLSEAGYVDGRNVTIEFRWAEGRSDRLSTLAADLVGRQVTVIVTSAGVAPALAAKAATPTIPVVFVMGADPVKFGLVASFNRPGGNLTGVSFLLNVLVPKRLQVLHELVPTARAIGALANPNTPNAASDTKNVEAAARALRLRTHVVTART